MRDFEIASSEDCNMMKNGMRPVHPGEILREEYLAPMGMSVHALAQALRVPATRLHEIVKERRLATPDTVLCGWRATSVPMLSPG